MPYPSDIFDPRVVENVPGRDYEPSRTQRIFAEDINYANDEIVAIEETLGENPQGSEDTVVERLDAMDAAIAGAGGGDTLLDLYAALGSSIKCMTSGDGYPTQGNSLVDGRAYFVPIFIPKAMTITGVMFLQATQGNFTADNNNKIKLYSYSAGVITEVATTGNDTLLWKNPADTFWKKNFSSSYSAAKGVYYLGILYNNSAQVTAPAIGNCTSLNVDAWSKMDFTNSAGMCLFINSQTDLTTPITLSSLAKLGRLWWLTLY